MEDLLFFFVQACKICSIFLTSSLFGNLLPANIQLPNNEDATICWNTVLGVPANFDTFVSCMYLHKTQQEAVREISVEHTRKILGGNTGLVFYDVTRLYFESDYSDELREKGFFKDGKHSRPQVVPGLPVSRHGYPLSYSLFNGSQYEGYTMLPTVEDFVQRFNPKDFVVVADSGLMNKTNIALLESGGYKYITGARIKNESEEIRQWILSPEKQDGYYNEPGKLPHSRLIVGYSSSRAKKDAYNREKGVKKACKSV
jgi:transposase